MTARERRRPRSSTAGRRRSRAGSRTRWQEDAGFRLARRAQPGRPGGPWLTTSCSWTAIASRGVASFASNPPRGSSPAGSSPGNACIWARRFRARSLTSTFRSLRWSAASFMRVAVAQVYAWADLTARDRRRPWRPRLPDFVPHGNAYGFSMAMHKTDFEAVNGFDMRYVGLG